jgi:hypothetical protein
MQAPRTSGLHSKPRQGLCPLSREVKLAPGLVRGNGGSDPIPNCARCQDAARGGGAAPTVVPAPYRSPSIFFSNLENIAQCRPVARRRFGCVTQAPAEDLICTHTTCKLHRQKYHAF